MRNHSKGCLFTPQKRKETKAELLSEGERERKRARELVRV